MTQPRVVIVGGGLAGLAAAAALGTRGCRVTLLESRPRWGGRASSFTDQATGETIDNCQHVAMGCCTNFFAFCRQVGIDGFFRREQQLYFFDPEGRCSRFHAVGLPVPLHLAPALMRLSYLTLREKMQLSFGLRALARSSAKEGESENFAHWLARHGQSPRLCERFWHVVLVSALSETLDRIHVAAARKVFVDGFLRNHHGWEVWIPTASLDELYGGRLAGWMQEQGIDARLQAGVKNVLIIDGHVAGVELRSGERIDADAIILAVPPDRVSGLLPESIRDDSFWQTPAKLESAPISSVHLWFDRPITELPHATFVGRLSHWLFNRSSIRDAETAETSAYYQVVISASRGLEGRTQDDIIREVMEDLAIAWPAARDAKLQHGRLVTEHKAVISMLPGVEELRPSQVTPIANLFLAGDWTRTGWPGTMEGAVRSGWLAAEAVLRHLQRPEPILQPDLPTAPLSKLLFGL